MGQANSSLAQASTSPAQASTAPTQAKTSAAQAKTSPAQASTAPALANTVPNPEEPPLPDIHENGEPDWELFATSWPPLRHYPNEEQAERLPHWVHSPTIPDPRTHPFHPIEITLLGQAYIDFKAGEVQTLLDLLGNASSFNENEIRRCAAWLVGIRRQLEFTVPRTTDAKELEELHKLIAKVNSGHEKAMWFLKKGF